MPWPLRPYTPVLVIAARTRQDIIRLQGATRLAGIVVKTADHRPFKGHPGSVLVHEGLGT